MKYNIFTNLALGILIIFASLTANVVLHELGHFIIADSLNLNPSIHLESPVNISEKYVTTNFAYVSYASHNPGTTIQDALIAFGGPLINAALALICAAVYIFSPRKNKMLRQFLLIFLLISALSCAINLIPIAPSDGSVIYNYFMR